MGKRPLLYYITDRNAFPGNELERRRRLLLKITEAAQAGVDYIQLREKDLPTRKLESLAREALNILNQLRTQNPELRTALLINSRTDVVLAAGADGVHLRSDDISPRDVKHMWQRGAILVPPLRERREDIRQLVQHFVEVLSKRVGKRIEQIPETTMNAFIEYLWPGNVRELQNLIERAVIRSDNGVLPNPLPTPQENRVPTFASLGTLRNHETAVILEAVRATGGMIGGQQGAAARLGLKRSTLISKMKKLGIFQPRQRLMTEFVQRLVSESDDGSELTM